MSIFKFALLSFPALLLIQSVEAQNKSFFQSIQQKQERKSSVRWTLADWLAQKERNSWMDQWLSFNTKENPYEFYISVQSSSYKYKVGEDENSYPSYRLNRLSVGAFASVVGLTGEYETYDQYGSYVYSGGLSLRIFGKAEQSTNITLHYGITERTEKESSDSKEIFRNQFGAVSSALYLTHHFGLSGKYKWLIWDKSDKDNTLQGSRWELGAFIDFSFIRISGFWFQDYWMKDIATTQVRETIIREGLGAGLTFFF